MMSCSWQADCLNKDFEPVPARQFVSHLLPYALKSNQAVAEHEK